MLMLRCAWKELNQVTCFRFDIGARARKSARFLGRVHSELLNALIEEMQISGITPEDLARKLKIPCSVVNRQLAGGAVSLRALSDLAWALDREITFKLARPVERSGQNDRAGTSTIGAGQVRIVGKVTPGSSTVPSAPEKHVALRYDTAN